ncbi:MAG TPA: FecR domain-containing protein [Polyangiaceae bacterium]|nr:FecR domain-containing protein [Polyangiaceae bacterium]
MSREQLEEQLKLARRAAPPFGLARQQTVIWAVRRRSQPWRPTARDFRLAAVVLVCFGLALSGGYAWLRSAKTEASIATRNGADERWQLRDGSRIVLESASTVISKRHESPSDVLFELSAGSAHFDVAHRPERAFRIQAGPVRVEVIGTEFRIERLEERARVSVLRGRVRVSWLEGSRVLSAGESDVFPPQSAPAVATESAPASSALAPSTAAAVPSTPLSSALPSATAPTRPTAEALFAAADSARSSGRPLDAVSALQQLSERFPRDPRAPLAAFTRGRILLETLGRPADAARTFAEARALAGARSALGEDALAREVDALRAAGNLTRAAERAELYRKLHPNGLRLRSVLRAGGISPDP